MKALIADDDVFVRQCLMQMLPWQELDFSTTLEAADGAEALDIALREKPDLVITDVKMPQLNGLELSKRLKQNMVDVCVMLLSEHSDFSFVQEALQYGVNDYILKPLTSQRLQEIADKIRQAMSEMEMRRYYTSIKIDGSSIRNLIREGLVCGDDQVLSQAFAHIAQNRIYRDDLKHFCLMFLTELFDQTREVVPFRGELDALRHEALEAYAQAKNVEELLGVVKDACRRCGQMCDAGSAATAHVASMVEYIQAQYMDPDLSVAKVSERVHLSPIYTGALFKKCTGQSVVSYIHEVRIAQAKKLLMDDSISIREVSVRTGYVTQDYFTRLFSKAVGVTPSNYRSMMLSGGHRDADM